MSCLRVRYALWQKKRKNTQMAITIFNENHEKLTVKECTLIGLCSKARLHCLLESGYHVEAIICPFQKTTPVRSSVWEAFIWVASSIAVLSSSTSLRQVHTCTLLAAYSWGSVSLSLTLYSNIYSASGEIWKCGLMHMWLLCRAQVLQTGMTELRCSIRCDI